MSATTGDRGPLWPLLVPVLMVATFFAFFWSLPDSAENRYDPAILKSLSIAFGIWCLVMLYQTRTWNLIALAVLAAFAGDCILYAFLAGWYPEQWMHGWGLLIRSCFVTAAVLLYLQLGMDAMAASRDPLRRVKNLNSRDVEQNVREAEQNTRESNQNARDARQKGDTDDVHD